MSGYFQSRFSRENPLSRPYRDRKGSKAGAAKVLRAAAAQIVRAPARMQDVRMAGPGRGLGQEIKFFDCEPGNTAVSSPYGLQYTTSITGSEPASAFTGITELNCVTQGAAAYQRIGTKILMKSLDLRFNLFMGGSAMTYNAVRYMIIYDSSPNGAFPAYTDILSDNISGAPGFHSRINMANRARFTILRDRLIPFVAASSSSMQTIKEYVKLKHETQFKSTTGAIADITTGALYLVAFASLSTSACWVQTSVMCSRIRYYD